jgi:hypothetical protein
MIAPGETSGRVNHAIEPEQIAPGETSERVNWKRTWLRYVLA